MSNPNAKAFNPRTVRDPSQAGPFYVIAEGAPEHYVDGYGLCRGGSVVTLNVGVDPGKHMLEISPEDAAKAWADPDDAARLATLARARLNDKRREADLANKKKADTVSAAAAEAAARDQAQQLADGLARAAEAEKEAQASKDATAAAELRAADLAKQLESLQVDHAKLQTHAAALEAAAADKPAGDAAKDAAKDSKPSDAKGK